MTFVNELKDIFVRLLLRVFLVTNLLGLREQKERRTEAQGKIN